MRDDRLNNLIAFDDIRCVSGTRGNQGIGRDAMLFIGFVRHVLFPFRVGAAKGTVALGINWPEALGSVCGMVTVVITGLSGRTCWCRRWQLEQRASWRDWPSAAGGKVNLGTIS